MMLPALFHRVLRERWKGLVGWSLGLIALVGIQVSVYPTIRDSRQDWSDITEQFPEAFRKMFRMEDYTSPTGYLTTELFSFLIPMIFIGLATTWGARAAAEEEENGTADVLLSLPVSRTSILATRMMAMIFTVVLLTAVTTGSLLVATTVIDMPVGVVNIIQASVSCALLSLVFGGIAVGASAWTGHRGIGLGAGLGVAIAAFVLYSLAPLVAFIEHLLPANPFQWTLGQTPLTDGIDPAKSAVSVAVALSFAALAIIGYKRHDISS